MHALEDTDKINRLCLYHFQKWVSDLKMPDKLQQRLEKIEIPTTAPADQLLQLLPIQGRIAVQVGSVPVELRPLFVLYRKMEDEYETERHRRCVDILGEEEYDNIDIEYMIFLQVGEDLNFNGHHIVRSIFRRELKVHFPQLPTNVLGEPVCYVGLDWVIYELSPTITQDNT